MVNAEHLIEGWKEGQTFPGEAGIAMAYPTGIL
jgi:hypothetical protein